MLSKYYDNPELSDQEVLNIRRKIMAPAKVAERDALSLIKLNEKIAQPTEAWKTLFSDAVSDFMLDFTTSGYVITDERAKWFIDAVQADNRLDTETELSLLIKIMNKANIVARSLEIYMLGTVKDAVLNGTGSWGRGRRLEPGCVGKDDVELLRQILYSVGGEGGIDISTEEAEIIYDIHDATIDADNHESWIDLFSKMMACFVMAGESSHNIDEKTAFERDVWLQDSRSGIDWSLGNIIRGWTSMKKEDATLKPHLMNRDAQSRLEAVTSEEANWLINRVDRDGKVSVSEVQMLYYIQQESPRLHETLARYIDDMAYRQG